MSALQQPSQTSVPNPFTLEYVGKDISAGMNIQNRGAVPAGDSVYMIPYAANEVVQHNVNNNSQVKFSVKKMRGAYHRKNKYVGGVLAPNGKIYSGAHGAHTPLIIDTNTTPPTLSEVSGNGSYSMQARGPVYNNDRVYIPSYTGGKLWRVVDTTTDSRVPNINWAPIPRTDRIYQIRPFHEEESGMFYDTNFGAVNGGNDKMYGMPHGASRINILDTTNNKTSWGEDSITGNAPMSDVPRTSKMLLYATCFNKYRSGALANNGCIYAHGYMARSILKIDTRDDSAIEIPYPKAIIDEMTDKNPESHLTPKAASFSSVLGSDGKVYSVPWGIPYILWIDPVDDSIGFKDISSTLDESGSIRFDNSGDVRNNGGWYTYATAVGDSIYYSPAAADKVLKLTINNAGNPSNIPSHTVISNASSPSATPLIVSCNTSSPSPASPSKIKHDNLNIEQEDNTALIGIAQQPTWPKFKYLTNEVGGNLTKTRTMGLDASGKIHSLGYKSALIIETDTNKDTIVRKPCETKGYIGTVDASDGYTYYMPAYSTTIPKLNRATGELTYDKKFASVPQIRSGAEGNNGIIYMPTYTKTLKIVTLDTATGEVATITPEKPTRNSFPACNHIWGAAADKKGEIYMPQVLGTNIGKIDKNGIFKYLEGSPVTSGVSGWTHKYIGAIYVEAVDKVFCLPRCGKRILVINCADDSYVEVNLPEDYLKKANKNKNFHGFLAPDGWVYSAFWADTLCFRINPDTLEIQWKDYTEEFINGAANVKEGSGIMSLGTGYSTAALVKGNNVYLGLAGTNKAVKLEYEESKVSSVTESIVVSNTSSASSSPSSVVSNASCPTIACNVSCASSTITCNTSCPSPSSTPSVVSCSFPSPSTVTCCSSPSTCCTICSSPSASSCSVTCEENICAVIIPTPSPSRPKSIYCYVGSACCTQSCRTSFAGIWSKLVCDVSKVFCKK